MLRYVTAGESHGPAIIAILEGIPAGLTVSNQDIDNDLSRRQEGYGRGARMMIEKDKVDILSGIYNKLTLGSPITLLIKNKDATIEEKSPIFCPRPGHADLAGAMKYDFKNVRSVLERSSARETAGRVAAGAVCKKFLKEFDITVKSEIFQIGEAYVSDKFKSCKLVKEHPQKSSLGPCDELVGEDVTAEIDKANKKGDSLGGIFEVVVENMIPGLGSYTQWDLRLDGRLAQALMSVQAIKGVEIGLGFGCADKFGSQVHDEIFYDKKKGFYRGTNNAGGLEGGMSNGENIIVRAAMKPIPTLRKPLKTVDIKSKNSSDAAKERSDVCAVHAASIVGEAVVAFEIAKAFIEKIGGDCMKDMHGNVKVYKERLKNL